MLVILQSKAPGKTAVLALGEAKSLHREGRAKCTAEITVRLPVICREGIGQGVTTPGDTVKGSALNTTRGKGHWSTDPSTPNAFLESLDQPTV